MSSYWPQEAKKYYKGNLMLTIASSLMDIHEIILNEKIQLTKIQRSLKTYILSPLSFFAMKHSNYSNVNHALYATKYIIPMNFCQ